MSPRSEEQFLVFYIFQVEVLERNEDLHNTSKKEQVSFCRHKFLQKKVEIAVLRISASQSSHGEEGKDK